MCVYDSPLDVIDVCVVFKSSLEQASFFAELGDVGFVIMCEHLVTHDSISNLKGEEREREGTSVRIHNI